MITPHSPESASHTDSSLRRRLIEGLLDGLKKSKWPKRFLEEADHSHSQKPPDDVLVGEAAHHDYGDAGANVAELLEDLLAAPSRQVAVQQETCLKVVDFPIAELGNFRLPGTVVRTIDGDRCDGVINLLGGREV